PLTGFVIPETFSASPETPPSMPDDTPTKGRQRRQRQRWPVLSVVMSTLVISGVAVGIWLSLTGASVRRLSPATLSNGLSVALGRWQRPGDLNAHLFAGPRNFSGGVYPVPCHSHNDYRRRIPLLQALSAGCTSVEADLWLDENVADIKVGHSRRSLRSDYTLQSLYIEPLVTILTYQNSPAPADPSLAVNVTSVGVFETGLNVPLVLLLDFKSYGRALWPVVQRQLGALREKGWLTFWD
ncbi:MAG: Altered inheritance of mitochondria protein 6, partial [Watsoniomyces obsoletus]